MQWKITRKVEQVQITIDASEGHLLAGELEHYRREAGFRGAGEGQLLMQLYTALVEAGWT